MKPKSFLNFLAKEWPVIISIFEMTRSSSIEFVQLDQIISTKSPGSDIRSFIKRFEDNEVLVKELSYGSNYTLTDKADQIVELLLNEQQLGVSENIKVHIDQFDKLSKAVMKTIQEKDLDSTERNLRRIDLQTQSVRRQAKNNLQAIENLVSLSKRQESYIPLKQRYADVIYAWDEYIIPMGEFIDVNDAFDATVDAVVDRLKQSLTILERAGAQFDIRRNVSIRKDKILDMRDILLSTYRESKRLLEPLYQKARLNSEVTKGISNILDLARKEDFGLIDKYAVLPIFKKDRGHFTNNDSGIKRYYLGLKNIQEDPAPPIILLKPHDQDQRNRQFVPPLNKPKIINEFEQNLPVTDALQWAITRYPGYSTGRILEVMWLVTNHGWEIQKLERREYRTKHHRITGQRISVNYGNV